MKLTDLNLTRRHTLVALGGAAVTAGAVLAASRTTLLSQGSGGSSTSTSAARTTVNLATANYDTWLAQVGTKFSGGIYSLKLSGVAPLLSTGVRPAGLRDRAFALNFDVAGGQTMAGELIYTISHPQYGPLQIFLSAAGPTMPARMIAVFN